MVAQLKPFSQVKACTIQIPGSKSESNRLLILQALFPNITIENLSTSHDTRVLKKGLEINSGVVDIHHAGTAMRFLTAYFAAKPGANVVLTGSDRMQERPIKILVEALKTIGADITYTITEGYPPLEINGAKLLGTEVVLDASISSQYLTALLLIAPSLQGGLTLKLSTKITSKPYLEMTIALLSTLGVTMHVEADNIRINPLTQIKPHHFVVEPDWSAASYFYSLLAITKQGSFKLPHFLSKSLQGDAAIAAIYEHLGVYTQFYEEGVFLKTQETTIPEQLQIDLNNTPDIAQTLVVTCFGLGIAAHLTGLHTLRIKETDRLKALKTELEKLGATVKIGDDFLTLEARQTPITPNVRIATYSDHRMAMAFAPLSFLVPIEIENPHVVTKSYPTFWEDMKTLGMPVMFK